MEPTVPAPEPAPAPAVWSHEWDADTGSLRLFRDGKSYTSLLARPAPGVGEFSRARRAAHFLCDIGSGLLSDDHGWSGDGELASLLAAITVALQDIASSVA